MNDTEHRQTVAESPYRMHCMELWGGIAETSRHVEMNGLNAFVYSRPFDQGATGGDVYYFTSCASGRISRILLADVTGHGTEVADTARKLRAAMRRNVNVIGQQSLMSAMNREFSDLSASGRFATGLLLTYFTPLKRLSLSVAGHPPPLLYRGATRQWSLLIPDDHGDAAPALPLGISDESEYPPLVTEFLPGDRLLAYTDAFIEARDSSGQLLQTEGLRHIVSQAPDASPDQLVHWLVEALRDSHPNNLRTDDSTAIVIEPKSERIPLSDTLLAPFRFARGVREIDVAAGELR